MEPLAAIKSMLQLNSKENEPADGPSQAQEPVWKVLVYDQIGQDIISPLLKINQLREQGVTVHMCVLSFFDAAITWNSKSHAAYPGTLPI